MSRAGNPFCSSFFDIFVTAHLLVGVAGVYLTPKNGWTPKIPQS